MSKKHGDVDGETNLQAAKRPVGLPVYHKNNFNGFVGPSSYRKLVRPQPATNLAKVNSVEVKVIDIHKL